MKKLLPVLLMVFGLLGGAGAGVLLRPNSDSAGSCDAPTSSHDAPAVDAHGAPVDDHDAVEADCVEVTAPQTHASAANSGGHGGKEPISTVEYVKLDRQFVIPVLSPERVRALVVISLSLETDPGASNLIYAQEPKLRDAFLQVLFRHANTGGFDGAITTGQKMVDLRDALRRASQDVLSELSRDVLVIDIVRQDI